MNERRRRDISAVMVTVDREPGVNYLGPTLENLKRSDLLTSTRLEELFILDSGPNWGGAFLADALAEALSGLETHRVHSGSHLEKVCANINVSEALKQAAGAERPWVLFLEDDIDVCANFFDSVGAWLDKYAQEQYRVYPFGSSHSGPQDFVRVHCKQFYGTQCFAIRSSDAISLADYIEANCFTLTDNGTCYDLLMAKWVQKVYPPWQTFLAASPSFVQHVGKSSVIQPRKSVHQFASWPGREWSFV